MRMMQETSEGRSGNTKRMNNECLVEGDNKAISSPWGLLVEIPSVAWVQVRLPL